MYSLLFMSQSRAPSPRAQMTGSACSLGCWRGWIRCSWSALVSCAALDVDDITLPLWGPGTADPGPSPHGQDLGRPARGALHLRQPDEDRGPALGDLGEVRQVLDAPLV